MTRDTSLQFGWCSNYASNTHTLMKQKQTTENRKNKIISTITTQMYDSMLNKYIYADISIILHICVLLRIDIKSIILN